MSGEWGARDALYIRGETSVQWGEVRCGLTVPFQEGGAGVTPSTELLQFLELLHRRRANLLSIERPVHCSALGESSISTPRDRGLPNPHLSRRWRKEIIRRLPALPPGKLRVRDQGKAGS